MGGGDVGRYLKLTSADDVEDAAPDLRRDRRRVV